VTCAHAFVRPFSGSNFLTGPIQGVHLVFEKAAMGKAGMLPPVKFDTGSIV
jgi:hypothetical protein